MGRIGNEIVWAVVASVVCGALLASLIGGTPVPLVVILVAVAAGLAVTTLGRRRAQRAYRPPKPKTRRREKRAPAPGAEAEPSDASDGAERAVVPTDPPPRALVDPSTRRIGARANSLGARPTQPSDPPA